MEHISNNLKTKILNDESNEEKLTKFNVVLISNFCCRL
ncbi:hypothetical protein M23134_04006 [Microscilla marina ATCC 23134]|uniref:Uncharacterized protein n=1 Tax=Microscilla marina ATCC 23134 TaxID=313606 RepID=A1ZMR3_MICM2|nr:hypothetical protein M23134_04006 [Microscilla marina ATCC 23134]